MIDLLGWASSFILLATILTQVGKQWRERSSQGVSKWLFAGQTAASIGFTVYSALLKNWVFTVTNALLLLAGVLGCLLTLRSRSQEQKPQGPAAPHSDSAQSPARSGEPAPG